MKAKKCLECGRIFIPRCGTQKYCDGPHQAICKYCGSSFEYTCSPKERPKYCSQICINEGKKVTVREKYGVDNVSKLSAVKSKISEANRSDAVRAKREATCLERWGVDNVSKNSSIRAKLSTVMKSERYLEGRERTCLKKYGYASPSMCDSVKKKRIKTCIERYGMPGHLHSASEIASRMVDNSKIEEYMQFKANPVEYIQVHYDEAPTISRLQADLGVTDTPIYNILIQNKCSDVIKHTRSHIESDVCDFLVSLRPDILIEHNNRSVIAPQEVDIYLPEYRIGIECNPAATHNSSIKDPWGAAPKHYKYHQDKSLSAAKSGIFIFHIFGYEWRNNRPIVESMLRNLLHLNKTAIGGRETYVCQVSYSETQQFLNENHRQGHTTSKVRLGLRTKSTNELVSVMTFSHLRNTMGKTSQSNIDDWELSRFCNKLNTNVIGGASKLFNAFVKEYLPRTIVSFSDIAHTRGHLYEVLGFNRENITSPSYVWSDVYDNIYYHRVSCQKRYLKKLLHDNTLDIESHTEREIMESHGFVRVYDCGVIKWVYHAET